MGIYTSNRYLNEAHDWAAEIPANEAYGAAFGCAQILADCQANDMALFESTIYSDISEVRSIQEGYGYVNENAFTDVINKIVEMFKKLLAKIKGIFAAFYVKLSSATKNGHDLVNKYSKQIIKYPNWKGFKCKDIRKPSSNDDIMTSIRTVFNYNADNTGIGTASAYKIKVDSTNGNITLGDSNALSNNLDTPEKINEADTDDIKNWIVSKYIKIGTGSVSDYKELHTEIMDHLFEDKDTIDGDDDNISGSYFSKSWIKTILDDKDNEKNIKKFNTKLEKNINIIIDNLKAAEDALVKYMSDNNSADITAGSSNSEIKFADANSGDAKKIAKKNKSDFTFTKHGGNSDTTKKYKAEDMQKAIHALQKLAGNEQEVITKITAEFMDVYKFAYAQAKKLWVAAAAWSSGVHKESVEYTNAMADVVVEQFYTNMESIG